MNNRMKSIFSGRNILFAQIMYFEYFMRLVLNLLFDHINALLTSNKSWRWEVGWYLLGSISSLSSKYNGAIRTRFATLMSNHLNFESKI